MKFSDAVKRLTDAGISDPTYDARELFLRIGNISTDASLLGDADVKDERLIRAVERRAAREPLQYIIGEVGFYRESYEVTPDVLIPRQDTEHLVDYAVKHIPEGKRFLDICTGSGCIAISTLKNTKNTSATAIDISEAALRVAKRNSLKNGICDRLDFVCADALSTSACGKYFAILSNPPYVTHEAYKNLEDEIYFEPREAFLADDGGLIFYKRILSLYRDSLETGGFFAFEIGYDQGADIRTIAESFGFSCEIIKDYSGNDRVAIIK